MSTDADQRDMEHTVAKLQKVKQEVAASKAELEKELQDYGVAAPWDFRVSFMFCWHAGLVVKLSSLSGVLSRGVSLFSIGQYSIFFSVSLVFGILW